MGIQSKQTLRLMKFVAELKKNNYPNAKSFAKLLEKADVDENVSCSCSPRTIARDIKMLQKEYNAPIEYDSANSGYFLSNPNWDFVAPIINDDLLSMSILGSKLASEILPNPIKTELNNAVDTALSMNTPEFFDDAMIESILCGTGIKATVVPYIFKQVFNAWRKHQVIRMTYQKPDREKNQRLFEPHIIAFTHGVWYTKGYLFKTKNVRCYAIQRILGVEFGIADFITDKKLIEDTRKNGLFDFEKISGIRLLCDSSIAFYLYEHQKEKKFKIEEKEKDGSLIIAMPPAVEHEVIRWILGEAGKVIVLEPEWLRDKVIEAGKNIMSANRAGKFNE